jgi:hypothetical protein
MHSCEQCCAGLPPYASKQSIVRYKRYNIYTEEPCQAVLQALPAQLPGLGLGESSGKEERLMMARGDWVSVWEMPFFKIQPP